MITRAYKYRLYPNDEQKCFFKKCFFINRLVYNYALSVKKESYELDKTSVSVNQISKDITKMKNVFKFQPFFDVSSDVKDFTLKDLDKAYKGFFDRVKKGDTAGYPKFKSVRDSKQSFQNRRFKIDFENGVIDLPKCKGVEIIIDRKPPLLDNMQVVEQTGTITKTPTGKYFLSVVVSLGVEEEDLQIYKNEDVVGVDFGINIPFAFSNGEIYHHPFDYSKWEKRRRLYSKRMSKKQKGGSNWNKAKLQLARHYEKMNNMRDSFLQKLTTEITDREYKVIVLEDLKIKNMSKKPKAKKKENGEGYEQNGAKRKGGLNRKLLHGSFGKFKELLNYKCNEKGIHLIFVNPKYTSQTCPKCGHVSSENRDRKIQHKFICVECGHADNADVNAAVNIKNKGLESLQLTL